LRSERRLLSPILRSFRFGSLEVMMTGAWWKDAIIYGIDVERFHDGNGDGVGDFKGLLEKVPYLASLNITCIWLLPFYPSPNRDNGYDITDHLGIDPKYGTFQDFQAFLHAAGEHGMRVVVDFVAEHTSVEHPWFQAARYDEKSRFRNYYIWTHHPPPVRPGKGPMFPGQESSVWTYDEVARAFYHHRFYHFQPGLNHANPETLQEIERILDLWLSFGISGFRIDAASHLVERPLGNEPQDERHETLRHIYKHVSATRHDVVLIGEVDEKPGCISSYFDGEQLQMLFNFPLNNYLMLAIADRRAEPVRRALDMLPPRPPKGQWANFLRNLDEADLERLTEAEMERVMEAFAPKETMRIYGRGIRRRLAPMVGGDERRLKMAYSLLFSMPGAPVLVYGDEIGMGDDLSRNGRNAVRAPMQWSARRNAGFSEASPKAFVQPLIKEGAFGFKRVNVEEQEARNDSLLCFVRQIAKLRRTNPLIGSCACRCIDSGDERVLAHMYQSENATLLMLHNLAEARVKIGIEIPEAGDRRLASLLDGGSAAISDGHLAAELEPYGLRWLQFAG
jgi:maltose alpha-D-glucosyltransferase/alpha-amylase